MYENVLPILEELTVSSFDNRMNFSRTHTKRKLVVGLNKVGSCQLSRLLLFIILKSTHPGECSRAAILFEVAALSKVSHQEILSTLATLGALMEFL